VGTGYIDYDAIVKARALLGDEAEEFAAFVCHSKVYTDLLKLKDSAGRPLLIEPGPQPRLTILGVPIIQSDRLAAVASVYPSLLLKRNALVAWVNGNVVVEKDRDILANTDIAAVHLYYAAHRYSKMSGMAKPGVSILKTKAST
jgi:HK97 family phage major capsid protein